MISPLDDKVCFYREHQVVGMGLGRSWNIITQFLATPTRPLPTYLLHRLVRRWRVKFCETGRTVRRGTCFAVPYGEAPPARVVLVVVSLHDVGRGLRALDDFFYSVPSLRPPPASPSSAHHSPARFHGLDGMRSVPTRSRKTMFMGITCILLRRPCLERGCFQVRD